MKQNWPKRVTYSGRQAGEGSPTRTNGAPARKARMVRKGARVFSGKGA